MLKARLLLLASVAMAMTLFCPAFSDDSSSIMNLRRITTYGAAELKVVPDYATVVFAVKTYDKVLGQALSRTANRPNRSLPLPTDSRLRTRMFRRATLTFAQTIARALNIPTRPQTGLVAMLWNVE